MINLRSLKTSGHEPSDLQGSGSHITSIRFSNRFVGNFGEPLSRGEEDVDDADDDIPSTRQPIEEREAYEIPISEQT